MPKMPLEPRWERCGVSGSVQVDRVNKVLRGYVVAQRGPFKSKGRGEFDDHALGLIVSLMAAVPAGLKSRFSHPTESDDGLGKFLGRVKNPRIDGDRVRGDLHLDPTSFETPSGNLGDYVLSLAESDPDALSSSLVLQAKKETRRNPDGTIMVDGDGYQLPPVWRPTKLHASDVVDTGDAVDGILSADAAGVDVDGLPLGALWRGAELLDQVFDGQTREVVAARCQAWLLRYLDGKFGAESNPVPDDEIRRRRARIRGTTPNG